VVEPRLKAAGFGSTPRRPSPRAGKQPTAAAAAARASRTPLVSAATKGALRESYPRRSPNAVEVVVFGAINMDMIAQTVSYPRNGTTMAAAKFETKPGGKGANEAVAVARLGVPTLLVGRVGDDIFGNQLVKSLVRLIQLLMLARVCIASALHRQQSYLLQSATSFVS
jgi:hypothetical protein